MTVTIRRTGQAIQNEDLPVAIIDPLELAVWDLQPVLWLRGRHATMRGVITARPLNWIDRRNQRAIVPAVTGQQPRPVVEGNQQFLALGYGGTLTQAANGSMQSPDGAALRTGLSLTQAVICRTPVAGGVAGATPGGFVAGSKLNHAAAFNPTTNSRAWGIKIGHNAAGGRPVMLVRGDAVVAAGDAALDHRDGLRHFYTGIVDDAAKVGSLYVDGGTPTVSPSMSTQTISTLPGSYELRVGATGLPAATTLECQYAGDVTEVILFGSALGAPALATLHAYLAAQVAL